MALRFEDHTLAWVAEMASRHGLTRFNLFSKTFVDALSHPSCASAATQMAMIREEPRLLGDARYDVLLAGIAESIAQRIGQEPPPWTEQPSRFLPQPWVMGITPPLRTLMLQDTPAPFARRNLFCGPVWLHSHRWGTQTGVAGHPRPAT